MALPQAFNYYITCGVGRGHISLPKGRLIYNIIQKTQTFHTLLLKLVALSPVSREGRNNKGV